MTPILFVPELHFEHVKSWLEFWDESMTVDALPKIGYVVPDKAVGFLYQTDSSVCMIENIVAKPGLSREERSEAVDAVLNACLAEAKQRGFKLVIGYTQLEVMVKRTERLGFSPIGTFHLVAKPL